MAIGPLAELALNRAMMRTLRTQLADAQAIADRRARDAFAEGVQRGRAAWPVALLIGAGLAGTLTAIAFAWFA